MQPRRMRAKEASAAWFHAAIWDALPGWCEPVFEKLGIVRCGEGREAHRARRHTNVCPSNDWDRKGQSKLTFVHV